MEPTPATTPAPSPAPAAGGQAPQTPTTPAGGEGNAHGQSSGQPNASTEQPKDNPSGSEGKTAPTNGEQPENKTATPEFKVPDAYKDKPWAAKVKSLEDVYKHLDGLDAAVGKKTVVPDLKTATDDEREAYYAQTRPQSTDEYSFAEGLEIAPDDKKAVAEMFSKNGITAKQGSDVIQAFQKMQDAQMARQFDPAEFQKTMEASFGADWEKTAGQAYNTLSVLMSKEDNELMKKLPNAYAPLVYRTIANTNKAMQAMMKKYGANETELAHFAGAGKTQPTDIGVVRADLTAQLKALEGRPHTSSERQALIDKRSATYANDPRLNKQ